jgi:hypothetical protein
MAEFAASVIARKRAIQYAVTYRFTPGASGILDALPEPVIGLAEGETRDGHDD